MPRTSPTAWSGSRWRSSRSGGPGSTSPGSRRPTTATTCRTVGAGLAVTVDHVTHTAHIGAVGAGYAVAIPVALFLVVLWIIHWRPEHARTKFLGPAAALLILATPFAGAAAVPLIGAILATIVAVKIGLAHARA